MKMKKFAVAAAIAMMGMSLMACGGKKTAESAAESKAEGTASVKTVSSGKLIMATNAEFPPYEYHEGNEIKGIDVEICRAVAEKLGLELQIEDVAFDAIIPEVASGKADLAAAGMTVTEDRKQNMDFSDTYATSIQLILVQENSIIAGKEDLTGKKIGVQLGTTSDLFSTEDFGEDAVVRYSKSMEAVQALSQGKIDAVIVDSQTAKEFVNEVKGIKALDSSYSDEAYAIGVKKGNTELLNAVNAALAELKSEGKLDEIVTKYTKAE
nr:transporter substrate-binding domain-containing protein [uncultured Stomatobaculum sp.]